MKHERKPAARSEHDAAREHDARKAQEERFPAAQRAALARAEHARPRDVLGLHPLAGSDPRSAKPRILRAFHPDALAATLIAVDRPMAMNALGSGSFELLLEDPPPHPIRIRYRFADGEQFERTEPWSFRSTLGEIDLHLIGEGRDRKLYEHLGANPRTIDGQQGVAFAVWAPNARRVSVVGDFCSWDGRTLPMQRLGESGVFELFVPGARPGDHYKFELMTREGLLRIKADPLGRAMEIPPGTASRVVHSEYIWNDEAWMRERAAKDFENEPISIYEVHLGSWTRDPVNPTRFRNYAELAEDLVAHVRRMNFTHIELLPVAEHAYYGSWGYQVIGYYAPTGRYGSPDDLRALIDTCHRNGIGVLLDWVPAHFPKDDHALRRFDGTALYEHEAPQLGEHPDWGTLVFNYGRNEVRNFLIANALYWLDEFHFDGLRVDAVASMLYRDYSRKAGEWLPNHLGGRENIEAVEFLREFTQVVREEHPGALTVAEESTTWPGVTRAIEAGGLGFDFKWNMGWMHDTLSYLREDPIHRKHHQDRLTFSLLYEYTEKFINPLSHDEVVHLKGSLLAKMPGDRWQQFANLRLLLSYQFTRPGKKLLFMGGEFAQEREWNHDQSLDWHLLDRAEHRQHLDFVGELGRVYRERAALFELDAVQAGFEWIDVSDRGQSVISYVRKSASEHCLVVLNATPTPRNDYAIGVPGEGDYEVVLSSDEARFGGTGHFARGILSSYAAPMHGRLRSLRLDLPPLGAVILAPR